MERVGKKMSVSRKVNGLSYLLICSSGQKLRNGTTNI